MAKRKEIETSGSDTAANPGDATGEAQAGTELPAVESPSISPAKAETAADAATAARAGHTRRSHWSGHSAHR